MIYRRGVLPVLVLLSLVVLGVVGRIAGGSATPVPPAASPTPTPTPAQAAPREVTRVLDAVQGAFNSGDVRRLCRTGDLVDPAVVSEQNAQPGGCASELETLIANEPPMRLTVRSAAMRTDLATVEVSTARGQRVSVDLVRRGSAWLLSFSYGDDPMPALAG
jgi:hypothetical protein